jgi:hypothetical protein
MKENNVDEMIARLIATYDQHKADCVACLREMYLQETTIKVELEDAGIEVLPIRGMDFVTGALKEMARAKTGDELQDQIFRVLAKLAYLGLLDTFVAYGDGDVRTLLDQMEGDSK